MKSDMKAVLYLRYSCDNQSEQSIEGQRRVCIEFAERCGYEIIGEYVDRAKSATTDNRPKFLQMIKDAQKELFQFVIVYKLDRFSRNRYDSATYKHRLKQYGVKVVSATECLSDSPESIMTEALLEANAEYYSAELSQKTRRGMKETALKGNSTGGNIPLGYKVENKKLVIDEKTIAIPKLVFEMYAEGKRKKDIADTLNNMGYRTVRNNEFRVGSFDNILRNKKYIGIYSYNSEIEINNACPEIISKEIFDKVQKRLDETKKAPAKAKAKEKYYLSGKLFCGYCGAPMTGISGRGRNGESHGYYACRTKRTIHECKKLNERKDYLEWYICEQTLLLLKISERKEIFAKKIIEAFKTSFGTSGVDDLEKQIKSIQNKISKTADIIIETGNKAFLSKLEDLQFQQSELEEQLNAANIASRHIPTVPEIISFLEKISSLDIMNEKHREYIIDTFVNCVYLYDDKMTIFFNLKNTSETISFEQIREWEKDQTDCISNSLGSHILTVDFYQRFFCIYF